MRTFAKFFLTLFVLIVFMLGSSIVLHPQTANKSIAIAPLNFAFSSQKSLERYEKKIPLVYKQKGSL